MAMHAPLPASGVIIGRSRNTHVVDKGADKGALVITERTLHDEAGACLATLTQTTFCRGDGGFGGGDDARSAARAGPPLRTAHRAAGGAALPAQRGPQSAARRSRGGAACGLSAPILHGLCTYGVAAHAIVRACCGYDASRLASLNARFSAPVYPGETLQCDIWRLPTARSASWRARWNAASWS